MAALLSRKSAASLMSLALSTSALAEMTLDCAILLFLAASAMSDYRSRDSTISLMKTSSMKIPNIEFLFYTPRVCLSIEIGFNVILNLFTII